MEGLANFKKQLFTDEDPAHIHKTLGICCLLSMLWRFSMVGERDMGFQIYPELTLPTLFLHFCLTASAFVFHIPHRRIKAGDRIWPEYRLHALVFLCRSLAVLAVTWYEQVNNLPPNYDWNLAIVMATLCGSSLSSWYVGNHQSDSIRGLDTHPAIKFFFSFMQLGTTSYHLFGLRRFSIFFFTAAIVQITPFTMTLRRKNLISTPFNVLSYAVELVFGCCLCIYETVYAENLPNNCSFAHGFLIDVAVLLRLGPRLPLLRIIQNNKFLMWLSIGLLLRYLRPILDQEGLPQTLVNVKFFTQYALLALFVWKGFLRDKFQFKGSAVSKKSV